jgi:hypothetical protein
MVPMTVVAPLYVSWTSLSISHRSESNSLPRYSWQNVGIAAALFTVVTEVLHGFPACFRWKLGLYVQYNSTNPDAGYPDRLGPWGKFVEKSTKLTFLEITGYRIRYSTVLWFLELQIRRGRKVYTQVHTVNSNSLTSNCQGSLFSKKNPIIRIFCISGWLAVPINPDKWSSTVLWKGSLQPAL